MSQEHLLGMSVKETLMLLTRTTNELYSLVDLLQQRVLALELQVRCTHLFKNHETHLTCIHCDQERGF